MKSLSSQIGEQHIPRTPKRRDPKQRGPKQRGHVEIGFERRPNAARDSRACAAAIQNGAESDVRIDNASYEDFAGNFAWRLMWGDPRFIGLGIALLFEVRHGKGTSLICSL